MKHVLIGAAIIAAGIMVHMSNDYMHSKPMQLTVLEKYIQPGGYKASGYPVMVLQTEDGRVFDEPVSYATHYRFAKGDRLIMTLRRMDIRQSALENLLYVFAPAAFWAVGFGWSVIAIVAIVVSRWFPDLMP